MDSDVKFEIWFIINPIFYNSFLKHKIIDSLHNLFNDGFDYYALEIPTIVILISR
jgi:hypothetical protein